MRKQRRTTSIQAKPKPSVDLEGLHDAIEVACGNALMGDPPGPQLATRLQRECLTVLRAYGLTNATVVAESSRNGTSVTIRLPQPGHTVQEIRLRLS
jgi:hypothetical protein